jgi:hypothetical protein
MDSGAHTQATTHPPLVRRVQGCRRRVAQAPPPLRARSEDGLQRPLILRHNRCPQLCRQSRKRAGKAWQVGYSRGRAGYEQA